MTSFFKIVLILALIIFSVAPSFAANERGKVEYWLRNYKEVKEGRLFVRSSNVFNKVLAAADRRRGVEPKLYIIEYDGLPWAQSLEDGSIILTRKAVEFCYRDKDSEAGGARLAFVIGHELAHQLNADFWPYRFAQATKGNPEFNGIKKYASLPDAIKSIELQADQYGIIYAALAGFRTEEVISKDINFFEDWFRAIDPALVSTGPESPSLNQRAKAVKVILKEVSSRMELFNAGVIANQLGWHKESIVLLEEFLKYYPGREVYHNIGTAYLKSALETYRKRYGALKVPFHLSIEADPVTRAETIEIGRGEQESLSEFRAHLDKAIDNLRKASESDLSYGPARVNLGAAYILDERFYNALSELEEALSLDTKDRSALNNMAIAYFLMGDSMESEQFRERGYAFFKKLMKDECADMFYTNFAIAGRRLGKEENEGSLFFDSEKSVFTAQYEFRNKPGSGLKGKALVSLGGGEAAGMRLGLYEDEKNDEFIMTLNGTIKLVYSKRSDIDLSVGNKRCGEGGFLTSGRNGINYKSGIYFAF